MSREYPWAWSYGPRTEDLWLAWDKFQTDCAEHLSVMRHAEYEGGSSGPDEVTVFVWANQTKASRLKMRLDAYFGVVGRIKNLADLPLEDS